MDDPAALAGVAHPGEPRRKSSASVKERVVRHIREMIRLRRLRPGDRLPTERELALELGVSRPSVRSALQSLAAMGVLSARRRAGTFIQGGPPVLDSEPLGLLAALHDFDAEQMFEARASLEVVAAGLAARRASAEQRAAMADELTGLFASLSDPPRFLVHDVRFHRAVAAGSNNPVTAALVDMVSVLLFDRRRATIARARDLRESAEMHQRIYQAISSRNASRARAAMADHLRLALEGWATEEQIGEGRRLAAAAERSKAKPIRPYPGREEH
jgi:GntR family transcriptional regulator, transcriptional repressor for pyruvate dehydrogenase complex